MTQPPSPARPAAQDNPYERLAALLSRLPGVAAVRVKGGTYGLHLAGAARDVDDAQWAVEEVWSLALDGEIEGISFYAEPGTFSRLEGIDTDETAEQVARIVRAVLERLTDR